MTSLHLHVNEIPSPLSILLFGLQLMIICLSALLVVPYIVSDMLCAGQKALEIRVQLISATFVTSVNVIQSTRNVQIFGSCLIAVLIMPILGFTGLVGKISKYIGPVTIVPIMSLLTIGTVPDIEQKMEPPGGEARTDRNASLAVLEKTPWKTLQTYALRSQGKLVFPLEHQSCLCSCCILAALWGVGSGITCYVENIAIMSVTMVTSRITMQIAGVLLILAGIVSKFAAFLSMILEPIIGGLLAMGMCLINGVSLSNLAVSIPPKRNKTIDDVFGSLLTIRMLIGGLIAFTLDNIAPGASRKQSGFLDDEDIEEKLGVEYNGYAFPSSVNKFFFNYSWLTYLPVIPSRSAIQEIEDDRRREISMEKI
ncbi:hypothetical protein CRE_15040 [Caenorhabditis remanei]|uniref:Uncharacterized protein n=1 Tax=Caenorhabditis remanei TaxID=31234 RepID=E3NKA5_CAERE|nr:hypothetical protein CRE_15040 [Caenorhabditis remanei]